MAITDAGPRSSIASIPQPSPREAGLDRIVAATVCITAGYLGVALVLAILGVLRGGPVVLVGTLVAYSLWVLWTQDDVDPLPEWSTTTWAVAALGLTTVVVAGLFATGRPLVDEPVAAVLPAGVAAARDGALEHPVAFSDLAEMRVEPVGQGVPGLDRDENGWSFNGAGLPVVAVAIASWLSYFVATKLGAVAAGLAVVAVGLVAGRLTGRAALLAPLLVALSPVVWWVARVSPVIPLEVFLGTAAVGLVEILRRDPVPPPGQVIVAGVAIGMAAIGGPVALVFALAAILRATDIGSADDRIPRGRLALAAAVPMGIGVWEAVALGRPRDMAELAVAALVLGIVVMRPAWGTVTAATVEGAALLAAAIAADAGLVAALRVRLGSPVLVVGGGMAAWLIARAWATRREHRAVPLGGLLVVLVLGLVAVLGPDPVWHDEMAAVLLVPLALAVGIGAERWFSDPDRYVLQTVAFFGILSLFVVPAVNVRNLVGVAPQDGAATTVAMVCDHVPSGGSVLLAGRVGFPGGAPALGLAIHALCGVDVGIFAEPPRDAAAVDGNGTLLQALSTRVDGVVDVLWVGPAPGTVDHMAIRPVGTLQVVVTPTDPVGRVETLELRIPAWMQRLL